MLGKKRKLTQKSHQSFCGGDSCSWMGCQVNYHDSWLSDYLQGVPKKCPFVLNCHNSIKIGTRNKSRVSFEILRNSSCWWALKFFNFDFWGLRKWGLKLVTLCLKAWPNQPFSGPVCLGILRSKIPFTLEYLSLIHKENHWNGSRSQ